MATQNTTTAQQLPTMTISTAKLSAMLGINGEITDLWTTNYDGSITIEYAPAGSVQESAVEDAAKS